VVDDIPDEKFFKRQNKNAIKGIDFNFVSYQYFDGVDLLSIPGVSHATVLTLMSEIGPKGLLHNILLPGLNWLPTIK